ncbi:hypothetical protein IP88_13615 [alpha proteobacterium AAP81b]|nr:hypothetical protein IP88_13615 [alpha proteobacterium AAP81b]
MSLSVIATAAGLVAAAEIGDKTQLLAVLLATRFGKPVAVCLGILVATLANHALAAWAGSALMGALDAPWFRYAIAASFIAMAGWALIPDKPAAAGADRMRFGVVGTTAIAFFFVEIGDKTQLATVALGARYGDVLAVTIGTTVGMLIANVPVVFAGEALLRRLPLTTVRLVAAAIFLVMGIALALSTAGVI